MPPEGPSELVTPHRTFYFGLRPRYIAYGSICPRYSDRIRVISQERWRDFSLRHLVWRVLDQGRQHSCVGASTAAALMLTRAQAGLRRVELSIGSIYGQINDGVDHGAFLHRALQTLVSVGACPASIIPHAVWDMSQWSPGWQEHAAKYRVVEWYDCVSFTEIVSALLCGFAVPYGIVLPRTFTTDVDKDGFVFAEGTPEYAHAMLGIGVKYANGQWWIETQNSWGTDWGNGGFCFIPQRLFEASHFMFDAWAVRVAKAANCRENA